MKKIKVLLLIFLFTPLYNFCNGQTILQTKDYIKDRIKSKPFADLRYNVIFGDEILNYRLEQITGQKFDDEVKKRLMIIECSMLNNGVPFYTMIEYFDVKGLRSVNIVNQRLSNGKTAPVFQIGTKNGYSVPTIISRGEDKYETKGNRDVAELGLDMSASEMESLKKAILHLSKSFGGEPLNEKLF